MKDERRRGLREALGLIDEILLWLHCKLSSVSVCVSLKENELRRERLSVVVVGL